MAHRRCSCRTCGGPHARLCLELVINLGQDLLQQALQDKVRGDAVGQQLIHLAPAGGRVVGVVGGNSWPAAHQHLASAGGQGAERLPELERGYRP